MLQRSVTLIRRLLCRRPKESTRRSGSEVMHTAQSCRHGLLPPRHYNRPVESLSGAGASEPSTGIESRVDPFLGAIRPVFLLPDRDDLFQRVDQPAAGLERLLAMGTAHGDDDAHVAQVQMPDAVDQGQLDD